MPRSEMGRLAAGNALGRRRRPYRPHATPTVGFTDPEVAQVGLTEAEAAAHPGARVGLPPDGRDGPRADRRRDRRLHQAHRRRRRVLRGLGGGRILGATVVAERAGELLQEPALAVATGMSTGWLASATHAYATWS